MLSTVAGILLEHPLGNQGDGGLRIGKLVAQHLQLGTDHGVDGQAYLCFQFVEVFGRLGVLEQFADTLELNTEAGTDGDLRTCTAVDEDICTEVETYATLEFELGTGGSDIELARSLLELLDAFPFAVLITDTCLDSLPYL